MSDANEDYTVYENPNSLEDEIDIYLICAPHKGGCDMDYSLSIDGARSWHIPLDRRQGLTPSGAARITRAMKILPLVGGKIDCPVTAALPQMIRLYIRETSLRDTPIDTIVEGFRSAVLACRRLSQLESDGKYDEGPEIAEECDEAPETGDECDEAPETGEEWYDGPESDEQYDEAPWTEDLYDEAPETGEERYEGPCSNEMWDGPVTTDEGQSERPWSSEIWDEEPSLNW